MAVNYPKPACDCGADCGRYEGDWCHAGPGVAGSNYGWPHVMGWMRVEGVELQVTNCIYCGKRFIGAELGSDTAQASSPGCH